jgi:magnesium transporter
MESVLRCGLYGEGRLERELSLDDLDSFDCESGKFIWIGLHEPDEELLRTVQKRFHLHDLAIEDALRAHQRPKIEEYGQSLFIVARTARWDEAKTEIQLGETHFFVGERYLVTVRHGPSAAYAEVRQRSEAVPHLLRKGPAYGLYAIMDFIVDNYFPVLDAIEESIDGLEDELFGSKPTIEFTERVYRVRRQLGDFKRIVLPLLEVFGRLTRVDLKLVPEDIRPYFRDVYDHVVRINESLDQLREIVHSALEANLALISVRQNQTMQMLAAWAAILAVPTLVAGLYGMNVDDLPFAHILGGFPFIAGMMFVACALLWWRFRRIGWL